MKLPHKRTLLLCIVILIFLLGGGVIYFFSTSPVPSKETLVSTLPKSCLYKISEFGPRNSRSNSQDGIYDIRHGAKSREIYLSQYVCQPANLLCDDGKILLKLSESLLSSPFREVMTSGSDLGAGEPFTRRSNPEIGSDLPIDQSGGIGANVDIESLSRKISVPYNNSYIGYDRPFCRIFLKTQKKQ